MVNISHCCISGKNEFHFNVASKRQSRVLRKREVESAFNTYRVGHRGNPISASLRCADTTTVEYRLTHLQKVWSVGNKEVISLNLNNGAKIVATKNTQLLTSTGWSKVGSFVKNASCYFLEHSRGRRMVPKEIPVDESAEVWIPMRGFERWYSISNYGRLKRIHYGNNRGLRPSGYIRPRVNFDRKEYHLSVENKTYYTRPSIAVLESFVSPRPKGLHACHNNGNTFDNRLENLRWDTKEGNMRDKVKHGTSQGLAIVEIPVKKISSVGFQETFGFSVESGDNAIVNGFIVKA